MTKFISKEMFDDIVVLDGKKCEKSALQRAIQNYDFLPSLMPHSLAWVVNGSGIWRIVPNGSGIVVVFDLCFI